MKSIPGSGPGRIKAWGGKGGQNGNLWFCGIFSNIGSRSWPTLWFHLYPRVCFPCQHTILPVLSLMAAQRAVGLGRGVLDQPSSAFTSAGEEAYSCVVGQPAT